MPVQAGAVWLPVLPDMSKWNTTLRAGMNLTGMSRRGQEAGQSFSSSMLRAVRTGISPMTAEVGAQARAASEAAAAAVAAESKKVAAARAKEETAAGKVRVAELKLQEIRAQANASASQVAAAEERLAVAQRNASAAADVAASADSRLAAAQQRAAATSREMSAASVSAGGRFRGMASQVGAGATSMGSKIGKFAKGAAALGGVFAGFEAVKFAGESLHAAQEFQQGSNVLVTAAGESVKNLGMVRKGLLDISSKTGTSLDQMTEGMYTVEKAGYRGAKGLAIMDAAAKGAKDEGADLGIVTNGLTTMMNLYGKQLGNPARAMNALMVAAGHSKTTLQEFTNSLGNVLPVGSKAGLNFNEIAGALGTMTSQGMSARRASQNLNKVIISLSNPTKVMSDEMQAFGLNSADVMSHLGKRGLTGTLELLSSTVKQKMGPAVAEAAKTLQTMPTKEQDWWASLQHGTMTLTSFNNKVDKAKDLTQSQKNAIQAAVPASQGYLQAMTKMTGGNTGLAVSMMLTGSAAKGFKSRTEEVGHAMNSTKDFTDKWGMSSKTAANSLAIAKQTMSNVGVELATHLLPYIAKLATGFANTVAAVSKFTSQNWSWLKWVAAGVGGIVAVVTAWSIAQWALNAALDANPVTLVVIALASLAVGLKIAYDKVGWFHRAVDVAWSGIKVAVGVVVDWFNRDVWPVLQKGFHAAGAIATWLWKNAIQPAWTGIKAATAVWWAGVKIYFALWYDFITKWIIPIIKFLWHNVWEPAFKAIGAVVTWWWKNVTYPMLHAFWLFLKTYVGPAISWLWKSVVSPVFGWIGGKVRDAWNGYIHPALDSMRLFIHNGIGPAISWLWNSVASPMFSKIGQGGYNMWHKVLKPTFDLFTNAVKGWDKIFSGAVTAIGKAWGRIESVVSHPLDSIKRIINGFIDAFNKVAGLVGFKLPHLSVGGPVPVGTGGGHQAPLPRYAGGGMVTGPWRGAKADNVLGVSAAGVPTARVNPGEFVTNVAATRSMQNRHPGALEYINSTGTLPRFADGGLAPIIKTVAYALNQVGKPYVWGAAGPGAFDCSGLTSAAWEHGAGVHLTHLAAAQHREGFGPISRSQLFPGDLVFPRVTSGGGIPHVEMYVGRGQVVEAMNPSLGIRGPHPMNGFAGGARRPALFATADASNTSSVMSALGSALAAAAKKGGSLLGSLGGAIFDPIKNWIGDHLGGLKKFAGPLGHTVLPGLAKKLASSAIHKGISLAASLFSFTGGGGSSSTAGGGVQRWAETIANALSMNGLPTSGTYVNAWLRQVKTESGGNPLAVQNGYTDVNTLRGDLAKGLLQVISSTFRAYHFPGHNNIFNGFDNALAAVNYAKHVYGSTGMLRVIGHGHGYAAGTLSAAPGPAWVAENGPELVLGPQVRNFRGGEAVLNPAQTRAALAGPTYNIDTLELPGITTLQQLEHVLAQLAMRQQMARGVR